MIVNKKALPRRTFLRGAGATLALPLLDAMVPSMTALAATLERYFDLKRRGTSVATEARAAVATFLTMVYILFVNPSILEKAGGPFQAAVAGVAFLVARLLVTPGGLSG